MPRRTSTNDDDDGGVGMVATHEHCLFCFETLEAHLQGKPLPEPDFEDGDW